MTDNEKALISQIDSLKSESDNLRKIQQKRILVLETENEQMKQQIITFKEIIYKLIEKI